VRSLLLRAPLVSPAAKAWGRVMRSLCWRRIAVKARSDAVTMRDIAAASHALRTFTHPRHLAPPSSTIATTMLPSPGERRHRCDIDALWGAVAESGGARRVFRGCS